MNVTLHIHRFHVALNIFLANIELIETTMLFGLISCSLTIFLLVALFCPLNPCLCISCWRSFPLPSIFSLSCKSQLGLYNLLGARIVGWITGAPFGSTKTVIHNWALESTGLLPFKMCSATFSARLFFNCMAFHIEKLSVFHLSLGIETHIPMMYIFKRFSHWKMKWASKLQEIF